MPRKRARAAAKRPARARLPQALRDPACYGAGVDSVRLVETHVSWVFLTGRHAYKVKKPVKLPFVDFSTLRLREHYCREELRINRRLAPELYLAVVPIGGTPQAPRIGRKKVVGNPLLYGTSKHFLVHFGLDRLTDLPSIEDFDQFLGAFETVEEPLFDAEAGEGEGEPPAEP